MRNIFFVLLAASFFLGACKDDDVTSADYFEALEQDTVLLGAGEGEQTVTLNTNLFVTPELDNAGAEWCEVEFRPIPPRLLIRVQPNPNGEIRSTNIRLKTDLLQRTLCVRQLGQNPAIVLSPDSYKVPQAASVLKVPFVANVDIQVNSLAKWITYKEMISGNQADTLVFDIAGTVEISRRADVELTYGTEVKTLLHIVQQAEDTTYVPAEESGLVKRVTVAEVTAPEDVKTATGNFSDMIDGDVSTAWSGSSEQPVVSLIFKFQDVERVDYMIYKAGAIYGPFQKVDLYVQRKGESEFTKYGTTYNVLAGSSDVYKMACPDPILEPQAIRMDITGIQAGNKQFAQCAEMEFYAFDASVSVFTDKTCSALKETVTIEQIQAMENTFLRNLAMHLYSGTYDTEFRVQEYAAYMNPDLQREKTKTSSFSYLEDPTGISVKAGEEIVVLVGDTHGEQIGVMLMDWENMKHGNMKPEPKYILEEGTNVFTADRDGLLYIYYMVNDVTGKQPVKIHIPTGEVNGYFNIDRHTNSQWKQLLQTRAKHKFLDVQGKLTHLLFPSDDFRALCPDDVVRLLELTDSIAFLEHDMAGLYKYDRDNMNRMFCRITYEPGSWAAFATAYHTAYVPVEAKIICDADRLRKEPWAMAHEFGHCHQIESFKWKGMTEVSNNVFSLYVQTTFGNESRILAESYYPQAHDEIAVTGISHSACTNVFQTLVPFWQLQLYFDKVLNQPDFYKDMYEEFRENEVSGDAKQQLNFVKQACRYGKKDLTKFFEYWGLLTEDDLQPFPGGQQGQFAVTADGIAQTKSDIAAMGLGKALAIQYLKDDNVELFRQNKAVKAGQVTLNGTSLTLTGWENVVAYEVYQSGKLIQVSQKPAFTLPSADVTVKAVAADGTLTDVQF